MQKYLYIAPTILLLAGFNQVEASNNYGPEVSMKFDEGLVSQDVTAGNAEDHLDNLAVALMEGRNDLLNMMDTDENRMDEAEVVAAKNYAKTINKFEKAALIAALKLRGNKNALKQVLDILEGRL